MPFKHPYLNTSFIHPELSIGEVFFTNSDMKSFVMMTFKTKRKGIQAYDGEGNKLYKDDWFPVFLQSSELAAPLSEIRKQWRTECSVLN